MMGSRGRKPVASRRQALNRAEPPPLVRGHHHYRATPMTYLSPYPPGCTAADIDDLYPIDAPTETVGTVSVGPLGTLTEEETDDPDGQGFSIVSSAYDDFARSVEEATALINAYEGDGLAYTVSRIYFDSQT